MNRFIALFLLVLSMLFAGCMHQARLQVPTSELTKDSTIALVETMDGKTRTFCSGVWVNPTTVVTARHCAHGAKELQFMAQMSRKDRFIMSLMNAVPKWTDADVKGMIVHYTVQEDMLGVDVSPKTIRNMKVVDLDPVHDLAILQTLEADKVPFHRSAPVATSSPRVGTEVHVVGHTRGFYWTYMKGVVGAVRPTLPLEDDDDGAAPKGPFLQIVAPIAGGNSGGGCFDGRGVLLGIASFTFRAPGEGFFIAPDPIRDLLSKNSIVFMVPVD